MKNLPVALFFLIATVAKAQVPGFQKLYGDNSNSLIGYETALTADTGILLCGARYATGTDALLFKLSLAGDTIWTHYYDAGSFELFSSVKILADGNILAAGFLDTLPFIVKNDLNGNPLWSKVLNGPGINAVREIIPLPDSGFIALADGYELTCIFRMSKNGDLQWSVFLDEMNYYDAVRLNDGTFVACGSRSAFPSVFGFSDISLLKFTENGTVLWEKLFGNTIFQSAVSLIQGSDGNLYITGQQNDPSGDSDILLIKSDTAGSIQWAKAFNAGNQDVAIEVMSLYQDQLMINGHSTNTSGNSYGFLLRTDESGSLHWFETYGDTIANGCWSMLNIDSGYIFSGHTGIFSQGNYGYRAVLGRTDLNGISGCYESSQPVADQSISFSDTVYNSTISLPVAFADTALTVSGGTSIYARCPVTFITAPDNDAVHVYPNPGDGLLFVAGGKPSAIELFSSSGTLVCKKTFQGSFKLTDLRSGCYYYRLQFEDGAIAHGKLIRY